MAKQFFYKIGDDTIGPLNSQQLRDAVARGAVQQDTLIQVEEGGPTVLAYKINGLFDVAGLPAASPSEPPADPTGSDEATENTEERSLPPDSSGHGSNGGLKEDIDAPVSEASYMPRSCLALRVSGTFFVTLGILGLGVSLLVIISGSQELYDGRHNVNHEHLQVIYIAHGSGVLEAGLSGAMTSLLLLVGGSVLLGFINLLEDTHRHALRYCKAY